MTKAGPSSPAHPLVPRIEGRIQVIRGLRVIIDADLATLYGVDTRTLNQAVKRNAGRFPHDFMFQLEAPEKAEVITNCDHLQKLKFSKSMPFAFTEWRGGAGQCAGLKPGGGDGDLCGTCFCATAPGQRGACGLGQAADRVGIHHRAAGAVARYL